jgi:hypothetical protein
MFGCSTAFLFVVLQSVWQHFQANAEAPLTWSGVMPQAVHAATSSMKNSYQ